MSFLEKIQADLSQAVKVKDEAGVLSRRLLLAELRDREFQKRAPLTDADIISVIQKEVKKRRESIEAFKSGNRPELVAKEESELTFILSYLPQMLGDQELRDLIKTAIEKLGATDFGSAMKVVMAEVKGRADGSKVAELVKELLVK